MSDPIVYIDRSEIRRGKLAELKKAVRELVEFVESHEPQLISYAFYFDEEAALMTLVAVHPDSASMEFHMEIGGRIFRAFADFIDLRSIDVYGRPSEVALKQLQQKAEMLGEDGRVTMHELQSGFARFSSATQ